MAIKTPSSQHNYVKKCEKAAKKGNVIAQNTLGYLYLKGQGVTQDSEQAANWFTKAAYKGYAEAQFNLAIMYKLGQGIEKNHSESIKWLQAAAHQHHAEAQANLGNMYYDGLASIQDFPLALMWWTLAEQNGISNLAHHLTVLGQKMTPAQCDEAKKLLQQWQIQH